MQECLLSVHRILPLISYGSPHPLTGKNALIFSFLRHDGRVVFCEAVSRISPERKLWLIEIVTGRNNAKNKEDSWKIWIYFLNMKWL